MGFELNDNDIINAFADIISNEPLFSPGQVLVSDKVFEISSEDEEFCDKMVLCLFKHSCNTSEIDEKSRIENSINIKSNKGMVLNLYQIDDNKFYFVTYLHPSFKDSSLEELFSGDIDDSKLITTHVMLEDEY